MDLSLRFANGVMVGDGKDDVGVFSVRGRYDSANHECHWTKSYAGAHDVFYKGFREGKGIWGTWEIQVRLRGGFHIWPLSEGGMEKAEFSEQTEIADAVAPQEMTQPTNPAGRL